MARRGKSTPISIADIVARVYPAREPRELAALHAFAWWSKVVPPRVMANARPVRLVRGELTVHAATAAWAQELSMLESTLLASIRARLPKLELKRIRVRVGPLPDVPVRRGERPPTLERVAPVQLPDEVARALAAVRDDGLREAIAEAASTSLATVKPRGRSDV